ncbi:hypothetical protein GN956_G20934 [Arapaima gigas]
MSESYHRRGRERIGSNMTAVRYMILGLLLSISPTLTASVERIAVYHTAGRHATLLCGSVSFPDCSETTWIYNSVTLSPTMTLSKDLTVKLEDRAERLSVGSRCSLHINNISAEDAGLYTCRQPHQHYAAVYLSVLTVTPQQTDSMLTLQCVLYTYGGPGWCRDRVSVRWVDHTATDLQKDHRYQVLTSPCSSNLTTKLESTGSNRRWTCEVTDGSQVKTSYSYTAENQERANSEEGEATVTTESGDLNNLMIAGLAAAAVVVLVLSVCFVLVVKSRRRTENYTNQNKSVNNCKPSKAGQKETARDADKPEQQYETIKDNSADTLTYAEVVHTSSEQKWKEEADLDCCTEYTTIKIANMRP